MYFPRVQLFRGAILPFALALVLTGSLAGQVSEQVIFNFNGGYQGYAPESPLAQNSSGRFYGTTIAGGNRASSCPPAGCGVVYELAPKAGGAWNYRRLYGFTGDSDAQPRGDLFIDAAGNIYGTALGSGSFSAGEVFKLSPAAGGQWTESAIHIFGGAGDGAAPRSGLITDGVGNLYGTTEQGGVNGLGTVYQLSPNTDGSWTETVLYSFGGNTSDGSTPQAGVIIDAAGSLYGTTMAGGTFGWGTVFELSPSSGSWTETILYSFTGHTDQAHPTAPLWMDAGGNLYGTTSGNAIHSAGVGTVFELVHNSDGSWTEKNLHIFQNNADGAYPGSGGLVPDRAGNLYGTTHDGGSAFGGVIFKMTHGAAGGWTESIVFNFDIFTDQNTGEKPDYGVTFGKNGVVLLGTTPQGGTGGFGAIYQVTP
jgi:uncharacterized repeat protein (TIGR03803 family)